MGLGAAIGALVTEHAWELPAAGATLRERWAAIAPELAGHVAAVVYDADSGRLTVCPEPSAWATKIEYSATSASLGYGEGAAAPSRAAGPGDRRPRRRRSGRCPTNTGHTPHTPGSPGAETSTHQHIRTSARGSDRRGLHHPA
ncbi:DUF721 domain-containing protein [Streptomyces sp. NPDC056672]|uniref:DUF721 domain-containing protein n=1 Tax=Streptomyces sp. NPDC056672 TaxID=3345906 RepID=UPI003684C7D1